MSLDKAIKYGKEKRKPYRRAKAIDGTCRNHGSCEYCRDARLFFDRKKRTAKDNELKEWLTMEQKVPFKVNDIIMCKNGTGPFIVLDVMPSSMDGELSEMVIMDLAAYEAGEVPSNTNSGFEYDFDDFVLRKDN